MTTLYAQPYDITATGFYFDNADDYIEKARDLRNEYGQPVEEFEIQFIDGDGVDAALFNALGVQQANIGAYLDAVEEWDRNDKLRVIIAVGEGGYSFNLGRDRPDHLDVDLYDCMSMRDLAIQFVDDGIFGTLPDSIANYIDYDAIARDLSMDYGETIIDGTRYIYQCG